MQATRTRSHNSSPGDKVSREISAIKQGLGELRNEVTELLGHAVGVGRGGAEAAKQSAAGAVEQLKDKFYDMKQHGADQVTAVERQIRSAPLRSVLIAFGAGFVFAKLFARR